MTDFYETLRLQYSPKMSPREFSDAINDVENELFSALPFLLEKLDEKEQNLTVEYTYKKSGYVK